MAQLVGVWRRRFGRLWLSLHGLATLGAGTAAAADGRAGGRAASSCRIDPALAGGALPASCPRREPACATHLVPRRQTTGAAVRGPSRQMEERCPVRW